MKLQENREKIKSESVSVKSRRSFLQNLFASTATVAAIGVTATAATVPLPSQQTVAQLKIETPHKPVTEDEVRKLVEAIEEIVHGETPEIRANALRSMANDLVYAGKIKRVSLLIATSAIAKTICLDNDNQFDYLQNAAETLMSSVEKLRNLPVQ